MGSLSRPLAKPLALAGAILLTASPASIALAIAGVSRAADAHSMLVPVAIEKPLARHTASGGAEVAGKVALVRCVTFFGMIVVSWSMSLVIFSESSRCRGESAKHA